MERELLVAALCCLALGVTLAKQSASTQVKDSESAASAPRLYRNVPIGVYASAAPHGAFSFQIPTIAQIKTAASRLIPVKEETTFIQNTNGFLKDSYGNRFVETPQNVAFKTTFPQQFVQLQGLPLHLSQPLAAASPNFEFKPTQFVIGPHYKLPFQAAPARYGVPQPVVFSQNLKSFAPSQGFGVPQSLIPAQNLVPTHNQVNHASQQSAVPTQKFAATLNFAAPHNFGSTQGLRNSPAAFAAQTNLKAEQQPTSNKAVYANNQAQQKYENVKNELKFQRLEEAPKESHILKNTPQPIVHSEKAKLQEAPTKHTVTTVVNGQKTTVNLETKPPIPLLDISLLEPLTFKNPLVPQVQHFLPRINQATYFKLPNLNEAKNYQKEFMVQKTKSYDSGIIKGKPQKDVPKKKQKRPQTHKHEEPAPRQKETPGTPSLNESPEITYEINMPGYKETYKEQALSYNKETQSEPIHYTYGSETEKEPVTYSFVHHSKEPVQIKEIHYQGNGKGPMQLIYNFKPEEKHIENESTSPQQSEDSGESQESEGDRPGYQNVEQYSPRLEERPRNYHQPIQHHEQSHHHDENAHRQNQQQVHDQRQHHEEITHPKPDHRQRLYKPNQAHHESIQHAPEYYPQAVQLPVTTAEYHPLNQYEDEISFLPPTKSESIKVDPNQHVQKQPQPEGPSPAPFQNLHPSLAPHNERFAPVQTHSHSNVPPQHIHEKSKRIIIQEETPEEMHSLREQLQAEMIDEEENNEQDFEKAYKNAAVGFPAYDREQTDEEKDIYNPDNYGIPREHSDYKIDHSPFQQYQREGDEFPKEARLNYKDARDSMKEDYYLDYSVSKPESLTDRYTKKSDYYKLYKKQKPENFFTFDQDKKKEKSAKYTAIPYNYPVKQQKPKEKYFAQYKAAPHVYEYDYSKETPKDNSAHATRPFQRYKSKTLFVEPQFQYGFEPLAIPLLLDSELAAMASNDSPESEKPGMRKKLYKENWYIKKTRTTGDEPTS